MTDDLKQEINQINTRLDKLDGDLEKIQSSINTLIRSIEPLVSEKKEKAIERANAALAAEKEDPIMPRMIKNVAEEYGLPTRALNALTRHGMKRMADFRYVDLERIRDLRNAGKKTILEIAAFVEHYGLKLPEHRDLEFDIKLFDEIITVYDLDDMPRGSVLTVARIKNPGKDNPFPLYECKFEKDGRRNWATFTPAEVRKVE